MCVELGQSIVLITGATGLIGSNLIFTIHRLAPSCQIIALVHSMEKAKRVFDDASWLKLIEADVNETLPLMNL